MKAIVLINNPEVQSLAGGIVKTVVGLCRSFQSSPQDMFDRGLLEFLNQEKK